ncbi:hypothetical protein COS79_03850 [Candidatus Woesearchaeota archaeon CG06_land_8_20_14_3_00_33_13]|nr:MAG: hypothetical protein COS79_03850 [Candidatus Woesearchaeota archaeon CG06_land_8_20_14_3_00_33_13]
MNIEFPRYIIIQTTSYCNANCIICPYGSLVKKQPQGLMDLDTYHKIIDEASSYDVERILLYLMNEPLMDKDIVSKINYAKEKNPNTMVHIVSNGSLLNKKLSIDLINSKLDYIEFSVLANRKESYRKIMHLDFNRTIKGILNFIKIARMQNKGNDYININITRTPSLLPTEEKDGMINFWREAGIKNINYFDMPISRAGNVSFLPKVKHNSVKGCESIWANEMMHILYNGDVILCCMDWKREVVLGNIKKESIYQIWNGERYNQIRKMRDGKIESPPSFICKRCEATKI